MSFEEDYVRINLSRQALNIATKRDLYGYNPPKQNDLKTQSEDYLRQHLSCSTSRLKKFVKKRIPITDWLPNYQWKTHFIGDAIAGVTVAIVQIPQGMGFALLANIPAICGIYMAFFPVIAYAILASSRHNSMGAFAIITIMTGNVVNKFATFSEIPKNDTVTDLTSSSTSFPIIQDDTYTPIQVATIVCFMSGVWSVLMGFFSIGSVTVFFNDLLVSAFSFGSAIHVLTSHIPDLLGISIGQYAGAFKLIYSYIDIFSSLGDCNIVTIIISAVSILVLALNNELLRPRLAKITRIPMPIELIVVVVGTATAYLCELPEKYEVKIVGEIPTGLPTPEVPPMGLASSVAVDSLVITIVAYSGAYSLAKIFGDKHDYPVDANQELYAMGFGNIFSSFFSCGPMASAIARVIIQDSVGGVTQLACLITSFIILWVLLFLGPLFEYLPKACLASIIVVALKPMFLLIFAMTDMWKLSRIDSIIWIVTALGVVILDVSYGLILGVLFAISVIIYRGQHPQLKSLAKIPNSDVYVEASQYSYGTEVDDIVIIKVEGPFHFANRENFKEKLLKVCPTASFEITSTEKEIEEDCVRATKKKRVRFLVLDCQNVSSLDALSAKFLAKIASIYEKVGVTLCLAALNEEALKTLSTMGSMNVIPEDIIFHSVHDAVILLSQMRPKD